MSGRLGIGRYPKPQILTAAKHYLTLVKPPNISVQEDLSHALLEHHPDLFQKLEECQHEPKLVHRLDRPVTGVMIMGRTPYGVRELTSAFAAASKGKEPRVEKLYHALVKPSKLSRLITQDVGKPLFIGDGYEGEEKGSRTEVKILKRYEKEGMKSMLLELKPITGHKHQLRRHCSQNLRAPIIGDYLYYLDGKNVKPGTKEPVGGFKTRKGGMFLHCTGLRWKMGLNWYEEEVLPTWWRDPNQEYPELVKKLHRPPPPKESEEPVSRL
ncbi:pseudouridine synthase [Saitoella complicata NRRL Y-17804]|uniref:pseudouridine synthase n=1 Tax=Saitoella complicata (strain BCRC 22490 / CBS 7301 / JCM 7358 / NBRC 10748 / NRRL Y-17804) TaxID=698492 RepID=UPI0008673D63|nr:pseudouridine synthase [Saitoella complicata NRRL Y-17804]ODQ54934.1 pseudouridine synthase [Saitoella complicata NRRL Y-17804]